MKRFAIFVAVLGLCAVCFAAGRVAKKYPYLSDAMNAPAEVTRAEWEAAKAELRQDEPIKVDKYFQITSLQVELRRNGVLMRVAVGFVDDDARKRVEGMGEEASKRVVNRMGSLIPYKLRNVLDGPMNYEPAPDECAAVIFYGNKPLLVIDDMSTGARWMAGCDAFEKKYGAIKPPFSSR